MTFTLLAVIDHAAYGNYSIFQRLNPNALCLNILIVFILLNVLHAVSNRWLFSATLITCTSIFLAIFHVYKLKMMEAPLMPTDIFRLPEFLRIVPQLWVSRRGSLIALALMAILAPPFIYWVFRCRWLASTRRYRVITMGSSMILAAGILCYELDLRNPYNAETLVTWIDWNQKDNYEQNGFFLTYSTNILFLFNPVETPKDYTEDKLAGIYKKYLAAQPDNRGPFAAEQQEPVNVILYLAEAFWDVDRLGVKMTADPLPFFHSLLKTSSTTCLAGDFISPTFAGYTAKTEFEILTGCSLKYLPEMSNPYASYIDLTRPIPTLPRIFKRNHYQTVAIHPYYSTMWDRATVYPELGFDEFLDIHSFANYTMSGLYISDESLVDKIIAVSREKYPYFIFGISMSTHGPYDYDNFLKEPLDVTTRLSATSHKLLKNYINALTRADAALKKLIGHFSREKQKTLIIIFGDHLPLLGDDMRIYDEVKYHRTAQDFYGKMHQSPVVMWANFPLPKANISRAAYGLKPLILQAANLKMGPFDKFIEGFSRTADKKSGKTLTLMDNDFKMVQYDLLFGKGYAFKDAEKADPVTITAAPNRPPPAYTEIKIHSYGPVAVTAGESFNRQPNGSSAVWFNTDTLPTSVSVTLNGKDLPTTVDRPRTSVSALVTTTALSQPGTYRLQLIDKSILARSPAVPLTVKPMQPVATTTTMAVRQK